ncbi:hypothetical protein ACFLW4_03195 [Chloroflexota bacterium]
MIEVHLYGKLRRFIDNQDPTRDSIIYVPAKKEGAIETIIRHIGITQEDLDSDIFLNEE